MWPYDLGTIMLLTRVCTSHVLLNKVFRLPLQTILWYSTVNIKGSFIIMCCVDSRVYILDHKIVCWKINHFTKHLSLVFGSVFWLSIVHIFDKFFLKVSKFYFGILKACCELSFGYTVLLFRVTFILSQE